MNLSSLHCIASYRSVNLICLKHHLLKIFNCNTLNVLISCRTWKGTNRYKDRHTLYFLTKVTQVQISKFVLQGSKNDRNIWLVYKPVNFSRNEYLYIIRRMLERIAACFIWTMYFLWKIINKAENYSVLL